MTLYLERQALLLRQKYYLILPVANLIPTVPFHLYVEDFSLLQRWGSVLPQMLFSETLLSFSLEIWSELCELAMSHGLE